MEENFKFARKQIFFKKSAKLKGDLHCSAKMQTYFHDFFSLFTTILISDSMKSKMKLTVDVGLSQ